MDTPAEGLYVRWMLGSHHTGDSDLCVGTLGGGMGGAVYRMPGRLLSISDLELRGDSEPGGHHRPRPRAPEGQSRNHGTERGS